MEYRKYWNISDIVLNDYLDEILCSPPISACKVVIDHFIMISRGLNDGILYTNKLKKDMMLTIKLFFLMHKKIYTSSFINTTYSIYYCLVLCNAHEQLINIFKFSVNKYSVEKNNYQQEICKTISQRLGWPTCGHSFEQQKQAYLQFNIQIDNVDKYFHLPKMIKTNIFSYLLNHSCCYQD